MIAKTPAGVILASAVAGAAWGSLIALGISWPWPLGAGAGSAMAHFITLAMLKTPSPERKDKPNKQYASEIERIPVILQDDNNGYPRAQIYDDGLPIPREKIRKVAQLLQSGRAFSGTSLAGRYKPLSRNEWEALRDWLVDGGHAHWRDNGAHSQGIELGRGGAAFFRYFVSDKVVIDIPTPSPRMPRKLMFASR